MKKFLKFARCPALKRLTFRLVELSARVASSILIDIVQISADIQKYKKKQKRWWQLNKHRNELNDTSASLKGAECSEWNRKLYTAPSDSHKKWSMRLWCGRSGYVIIFLYFLSCDKQVHVNFWSTYFQQDANRWQTFSLRRVRERPEHLFSLPPLKQPQVQTKRAGYCHPYWKGTILNKYVCYTSYTRVYDP